MLTPITSLSAYINAIGKAYVFSAVDPTSAASWQLLGITEGEIMVTETFKYNDFTLPEWTGDAIHERDIDGQHLVCQVPLIWGNADLYDKVAPSGARGGGVGLKMRK